MSSSRDVVNEMMRRQHKQEGLYDGMTPQYARDVKPEFKPGTAEQCTVPKHWYLGSLPPERLERAQEARQSDFVSAQNIIIEPDRPIEIERGTTFVAFLYHFFATTPIAGFRTEMLQPHELLGRVNMTMRTKSGGGTPYLMGSAVGGVNFTGMPLLTADPWNDWQEIPIFFNGPVTIKPTYSVQVDPPMEVVEIGFVLDGFVAAKADLKRTIDRCSVLDR